MIKLSDYLETPTMREVLRENSARKKHRRYAAARVDRINSDWTTQPTGANHEMRLDLRILRARARQMSRDAAHFKKFLRMVRSNVIGAKGIQLQVRAKNSDGSLNNALNNKVQTAFWEWTLKENCTASGKLSFVDVEKLIVTHLARDGEFLVQKRKVKNKFGFALKVIDVSYLDENYNEELTNGNRVIMSVEVDSDERPVAYYLTTPASEYLFANRQRQLRVRVPAEEIIHGFLTYDDETQTRGVTWFHAALNDAKNLDGYKFGVITSARAAASSVGFLKPPDTSEVEFEGEEDDEGREQPIEIDMQPLAVNELLPGWTFEQFDPKQPTQNHPQFYASILGDVATALDVNYFSLAGDMAAVNYSSARVGLTEERDGWREIQQFVIEHFHREVFNEWLESAFLNGALDFPVEHFNQVRNPNWRPRGWSYVDPQKEIAANIAAVDAGHATMTDTLAAQGIDYTEHLETIKAEREQAEKMGLNFVSPSSYIIAVDESEMKKE